MGLFVRESSVGLAWSAEGRCWGVRLGRDGDGVTVIRSWSAEGGLRDGLAARLAEGAAALGMAESTVLVAGAAGCRSGFVDVSLPRLNPEDLRNALGYELAKHAPVPLDKLVWGYRVLPAKKGEQPRVRLVYVRESEWGKWVESASGLPNGVDLIVPPVAVLDPLCDGVPVFLTDGGDGYTLVPRAGGGREVIRGATSQDPVPGSLAAPLAVPGLQAGDLAALPPARQQEFVPAILLAMHGLTRSLDRDAQTLMPVPYELRPRRNLAGRVAALVLTVALLAVAGLGVVREYRAAHARLMQLREQCRELEGRIAGLGDAGESDEAIGTVAKDLGDAVVDRPSLGACLVELSRLLEPDAWVTSFVWTDGKIEVQVQTAEDSDVSAKLKGSSLFLDIVPIGTTVDHQTGKRNIRLQMRAGYAGDGQPAPAPVSEAPTAPEGETSPPAPGAEGGPGSAPPGPPGPAVADPGATVSPEPPPGTVVKPMDTPESTPDMVVPPPPPPPPPAMPAANP